MDLRDKNILITGGTGSFGKKCVEILLRDYKPKKVIIFSRDEWKQSQMQEEIQDPAVRYFLGDVRDKDRLYRAFTNVDVVIHAAALKQVPALEYNPYEAVQTNIIGGYNVINAAIDRGVKRVIALSTDKAANPVNLYGATKLCSDKLFVSANSLASGTDTRFSVVRYGNVVGSRGSVIPLFQKQRASGIITITDEQMTRFLITLEQGVHFVLQNISKMAGGEIFVPKIPSVKIIDVAKAVAPEIEPTITGIRPGEKLHEVMVPEDDARNTIEFPSYFVIQPQYHWWNKDYFLTNQGERSKECPANFRYSSDNNSDWLNVEQVKQLIQAAVE